MKFVVRLLFVVSCLMCCCGFGLTGWGWQEKKLGDKATPDPVAADLTKLEAGEPLTSIHITVGPHYAYYKGRTVYSFTTKKNGTTVEGPETRIQYAYYPVVSKGNPDLKELDALAAKSGGLSKIQEEDLPTPTHFIVLVKTYRFKKIGDIPNDSIRQDPSVQGLVINEVSSLDAEEKNLILEDFPDTDFKKVLILEEGRTPTSVAGATAAMFAGIVILVVAVVSLIGTVVLGVMSLFGKKE